MPRVSLILPTLPGDPRPDAAALAARLALEAAGHEVDVIVVTGPGMFASTAEGIEGVAARDAGMASAAMAGLEGARGDILLVMDPLMGYRPENMPRMVAPLVEGTAELAIASRFGDEASRARRLAGSVARPFTGSADPLSGLVGVTRAALDGAFGSFRAVGAKFSLEMLGKVEGRKVDVPVRVRGATRRARPGWDDVRHLKRLADHRWGNASRLIQFCLVGASGMIVDLAFYAAFQRIFESTVLTEYVVWPTKVRWSLAMAGSSSILVALLWNFSLNRRMTFSYARGGTLWKQAAAYVLSNLPGVLVSLAFRLLLPRKVAFFDRHKLAAAVVGIVVATGISFSMSRWVVFRRSPDQDDRESRERSDPAPHDGARMARAAVAAD